MSPLQVVQALASIGALLTIVPVRADGLVDLGDLERALGEDVALVSVMTVNNEIGVVQDLAAIGRLAHKAGAVFHVDAAQGFGKVPIDVEACGIDLLSLTAHKIYGPKGVGALYRRPFTTITPSRTTIS